MDLGLSLLLESSRVRRVTSLLRDVPTPSLVHHIVTHHKHHRHVALRCVSPWDPLGLFIGGDIDAGSR